MLDSLLLTEVVLPVLLAPIFVSAYASFATLAVALSHPWVAPVAAAKVIGGSTSDLCGLYSHFHRLACLLSNLNAKFPPRIIYLFCV